MSWDTWRQLAQKEEEEEEEKKSEPLSKHQHSSSRLVSSRGDDRYNVLLEEFKIRLNAPSTQQPFSHLTKAQSALKIRICAPYDTQPRRLSPRQSAISES